MLVLSRKSGEAIVFPALDITVAVSSLKGKSVSLSIEAPREVRILRKELVPKLEASCARQLGASGIPHDVRDKLNTIGLSLNMLLRQSETGMEQDRSIISSAIDLLHQLDESLASHSEASSAESNKKLALLVDDNENESTLLSAFLRSAGFRVATALDGQAAVNFLELSPSKPDIVLLDMNMPGVDGPTTVKLIREREELRSLKLFAVSGMAPDDVDIGIGEQGVNRWFQKPIQPDELLQEIAEEVAA